MATRAIPAKHAAWEASSVSAPALAQRSRRSCCRSGCRVSLPSCVVALRKRCQPRWLPRCTARRAARAARASEQGFERRRAVPSKYTSQVVADSGDVAGAK